MHILKGFGIGTLFVLGMGLIMPPALKFFFDYVSWINGIGKCF